MRAMTGRLPYVLTVKDEARGLQGLVLLLRLLVLRVRNILLMAVFWFAGVMAGGRACAAPLHLGYSDWPGWVAWQIAIDKGWLTQDGLDVHFEWFDYSASIEAFSAGKLDG